MDSVRVFAPASVSNVGCGFDVMGFALESPGDELILYRTDQPGVSIARITGDQGRLPIDPKLNTAGVAAQKYLEKIESGQGLSLVINKKMPFGSGLGSSAASAVGAVFGANLLMGEPLDRKDLVPFAVEGEEAGCGSPHADNVAPALLGGFVLVRSYEPLDIIELEYPEDLWTSVVHPHIEISTKDSRNLLSKEVTLEKAISQWGNVGSLVAGLFQGDYDLIGRSVEDHVAEPVRSNLIPAYHDIKEAAIASGALGCNISGSGPSIFALCRGGEIARKVSQKMEEIYTGKNITNTIYNSPINKQGPRILD